MNYYNEIDKKAAAWISELIKQGLIPNGDIDTRSIADVRADDLSGYAQCHFFSGIAGWSRALELAGWPSDRPVWTGSCPCQPYSVAGKGKGDDDPRNLWPHFRRLVDDGKPSVVFGEQVASKAGREWLSGVRLDLEAMGYAVGAADLCSAGVNAPHIRQRLHWVAYSAGERGAQQLDQPWQGSRRQTGPQDSTECAGPRRMADAASQRLERAPDSSGETRRAQPQLSEPTIRLANTHGRNSGSERQQRGGQHGQQPEDGGIGGMGNTSGAGWTEQHGRREQSKGSSTANGIGFWDSYDLLQCTDGKARRVEPGTSPLVAKLPGSVGRRSKIGLSRAEQLRGYGNSINPILAARFIEACEEARKEIA